MKYGDGEIIISPKVIFWIEMPSAINDTDILELLRKDIFIIKYDGDFEKLPELEKSRSNYTGYFFNLEEMLLKNKVVESDFLSFAINIATFIKGFVPDKTLVHTNMINKEIAEVFQSNMISYLEKNLNNKKIIYNTISSILFAFFTEKERSQRAAIRLIVSRLKYKAEIKSLRRKALPTFDAYIKDVSMNGICLVISDSNNLKYFDLKDTVALKLILTGILIKIETCFVTRIDIQKNEIGLTFNINDNRMIREEQANALTSLFYKWLISLIDRFGKIDV